MPSVKLRWRSVGKSTFLKKCQCLFHQARQLFLTPYHMGVNITYNAGPFVATHMTLKQLALACGNDKLG